MSRTICVASNCQTGGVAAALRAIFVEDRIVARPVSKSEEQGVARALPRLDESFAATLNEQDVLVLSSTDGTDPLRSFGSKPRCHVARMPTIRFTAFHPDLCYARGPSGQLVVPHYNSAIAIWAYNRGLDPHAAAALFCRETYSQLGYLDRWEQSVKLLRTAFEATSLDFARFFLPLKRQGNFMYSINHPGAPVLVQLAKVVARTIGAADDVYDQVIHIEPGLSNSVWPLYPEIAEELSLPGGAYAWRMGPDTGARLPCDYEIHGLGRYLEYSFANYAHFGLERGSLKAIGHDVAAYDRILEQRMAST